MGGLSSCHQILKIYLRIYVIRKIEDVSIC